MTIAAPIYLSQSEGGDWSTCHLRAWARHVLGYKSPEMESLAQRVGSIGHALVAERIEATWYSRAEDPRGAVAKEALRRRWPGNALAGDFDAEIQQAAPAVVDLWRALDLDRAAVLPDLTTGVGGPMTERRIRVPWRVVHHEPTWESQAMSLYPAVYAHYAGIEGTPDLVMMPQGAGGPVVVVDYKFRQKPDLGGAVVDPRETVPNRQAAWYLVLLRAAGITSASGFEFWQANVFAGRRLTADDFIRVSQRGAQSEAEEALVVSSGLPTRDLDKIGECGMVSPEEWAEAHRVLANIRHDRRMAEWRSLPPPPRPGRAKPKPAPERLTASEVDGANRCLANLRALPPVVIRRVQADPYVCREVVRDMIVGVDGPLGQVLRGLVPGRNVQDHRGSPCVRPFGCPIQTPCLSSIGTWNIRRVLEETRDAGALAVRGPNDLVQLGKMPAPRPLWRTDRLDILCGQPVRLETDGDKWRVMWDLMVMAEGDDPADVWRSGQMAIERVVEARSAT